MNNVVDGWMLWRDVWKLLFRIFIIELEIRLFTMNNLNLLLEEAFSLQL